MSQTALPSSRNAAPTKPDSAVSVGRANHSSPASQTITSVIAIKVNTGIRISSSRVQMMASSSAPRISSTSGSGQKNDSVSWLANQMV